MNQATLKVLGLGFKKNQWNHWLARIRIQFKDLNVDQELLTKGRGNFEEVAKNPVLSWQPHIIFSSLRYFKDVDHFIDFFSSCSKLSGYRLGAIFLIEEKLELFIEKSLSQNPSFHFQNQGKEFLKDPGYLDYVGVNLPHHIPIVPTPLFEWKESSIKRDDCILAKDLVSVTWKDKDFPVADFLDVICQEYRMFHFRSSIIGFERKDSQTFLFTGFSLPELFDFSFQHFSVSHVIQEGDLSSKNYDALLYKIRDIAFGEHLKSEINEISSSRVAIRANAPIQLISYHKIQAEIFRDILKQNGFRLVESKQITEKSEFGPMDLKIELEDVQKKDIALNISKDINIQMTNPEIEKSLEFFQFHPLKYENLQNENENKSERFVLDRKIDKLIRRQNTLKSQEKLYEHELDLLIKAESKIKLIETLLKKAIYYQDVNDLPKLTVESLVYISFDEQIAANISQHYKYISKRVWLNQNSYSNWQSMAAFPTERYEEFRTAGGVLISEVDAEQLYKIIEKAQSEMFPLKQHKLDLNAEILDLSSEQEELESQYKETLYIELLYLLHHIYSRFQTQIDMESKNIVKELNYLHLSPSRIHSILTLSSIELNQFLLKEAFSELFPQLHSDQIKTKFVPFDLIKRLDYDEEEDLRTNYPDRNEFQAKVTKILTDLNSNLIKKYIDLSMLEILQEKASLLIIEQETELVIQLVKKLRETGTEHQYTPIIAFVSRKPEASKIEQLICLGVYIYYRGWNPKLNRAKIVHLLQPFISAQKTQ